ncbi:hypothetical protein ACVWU4_000951 [Campylobacter coli]
MNQLMVNLDKIILKNKKYIDYKLCKIGCIYGYFTPGILSEIYDEINNKAKQFTKRPELVIKSRILNIDVDTFNDVFEANGYIRISDMLDKMFSNSIKDNKPLVKKEEYKSNNDSKTKYFRIYKDLLEYLEDNDETSGYYIDFNNSSFNIIKLIEYSDVESVSSLNKKELETTLAIHAFKETLKFIRNIKSNRIISHVTLNRTPLTMGNKERYFKAIVTISKWCIGTKGLDPMDFYIDRPDKQGYVRLRKAKH